MSGGKGGSETSEVKVPQYIEDAGKANLAKADLMAQIGPVTNYGPDVAAFSPMQQAAFGNTASAAGAFGMGGGGTGMEGVPAPTEYAGGIQGYSSAPLFEQSMAELKARSPGQYAAINAPFIDPVTGASPGSPYTGSTGMQAEQITGSYPGFNSGGGGTQNNNNNDPFNIAPSYSNGSGYNSKNPTDVSYTGNTPGQMSNASYTPPAFSGGGSDGFGNYGKVGDYFGGIGDAVGVTNYDGSDSNKPSGNDGGKLVCTAMNKMGLLPDDIYALDAEYGLMVNRNDPILGDGYRLWALPVSEYIKRSTLGARTLRAFMRPITLVWAKEMAHQMRPKEYKPNYAGKVIMAIGHPTCRVIGHVFIGGLTKKDA